MVRKGLEHGLTLEDGGQVGAPLSQKKVWPDAGTAARDRTACVQPRLLVKRVEVLRREPRTGFRTGFRTAGQRA